MENRTIHPLEVNTSVYTKEGKGFIKSCNIVNNFLFLYAIKSMDGTKEYEKLSIDVYITQEELDAYLLKCCLTNQQSIVGNNVKDLTKDMVNHPSHYGGKDNPMEVIKIIDHYKLPFSLGNTLKYILRADKKVNKLEDLKKAAWYLQHEITKLENI